MLADFNNVNRSNTSWELRVASYEFENEIASCKKNWELAHLKWELGIDLHKLGK